MTLAELVSSMKNDGIVVRKPDEEEALERFEHFRERNYLVDDILEGKTTFTEALKPSRRPWYKRMIPFTAETEDAENLEYLLTVPFAKEIDYEAAKITPVIIPHDYYERNIRYPLSSSHWSTRINNGINFASKYIAGPFFAGIITSAIAGIFSREVAAPASYAIMATMVSGFAINDIKGFFSLPKTMKQRAEMLDQVVADVYNPASNSDNQDSPEMRHRLSAQLLNTASAHYIQGRSSEARKATLEAVKLNPLALIPRQILMGIYSFDDDVRFFEELREARVLFGGAINQLDMKMSILYAKYRGAEGNIDGEYRISESTVMRVGIRAADKFIKVEMGEKTSA